MTWRHRRPDGSLTKWYKRRGDDVPTDAEGAIAAFAANGVDATTATIRVGRWVKCPRCNGTGYHQGGPCFRCYGSAPATWDDD